MKKDISNEEYFASKNEEVKKLLKYFELDNLTFNEQIAVLTPLVDSASSGFYNQPNLKMPFDMHDRVAVEYHSRILLVLLKYIMQSNDKLDSLSNIDEQNKIIINQNQQIIELLTKISEK